MTKSFKAVAISSVAALAMVAAVGATPAQAGGWGGPVAAGVIGGLALGAILSQNQPYYGNGYAYGNSYAYGGNCYLEERPVYNRWNRFLGYRNVRV